MEYAKRQVPGWYLHVNGTLGARVQNGSLYLVTGADKSSNWCLASYSNRLGQNPIPLRFTADTTTTANRRLWQGSGLVDLRTRSVLGEDIQNQCVFIRGYKLAINENLFEKSSVRVEVSDIVSMEPVDVLAKGITIPGLSFFSKRAENSRRSDLSNVESDKDIEVEEFPNLGEVSNVFSVLPDPHNACKPYHPSTRIIRHLLNMV
jgi:hypothetical protein